VHKALTHPLSLSAQLQQHELEAAVEKLAREEKRRIKLEETATLRKPSAAASPQQAKAVVPKGSVRSRMAAFSVGMGDSARQLMKREKPPAPMVCAPPPRSRPARPPTVFPRSPRRRRLKRRVLLLPYRS
jgi:hypothetical protein